MQMKKAAIKCAPFPMPVVVVSTVVDGRINHLAVGWFTYTNLRPPMIGFGLNRTHHTNHGLREHGVFGVSVPSLDQVRATDYVGLVSGATVDKSEVFEVFYGELAGAPLIADFPVAMACRLNQVIELPSHQFFVGEIVEVYGDEACLEGDTPSVEKIRPLILTMPDCRYWSMGAPAGEAWAIGKGYR